MPHLLLLLTVKDSLILDSFEKYHLELKKDVLWYSTRCHTNMLPDFINLTKNNMSKFVDEIVKDIKENPETWTRNWDNQISKWNILIRWFGNNMGWFYWISVVEVKIGNSASSATNWQLSYLDAKNLEEVFIWWLKNIPLSHLTNN